MSDHDNDSNQASSPWRQPIIWLVIALVGAAVIGSVVMLRVAGGDGSADSVPDDVRRTAGAQVADLAPDEVALQRQLSAIVRIESPNAGLALRGGPSLEVRADAQQVLSLPLEVTAPAGTRGRQRLRFVIEANDGSAREQVDSNFFGPIQ